MRNARNLGEFENILKSAENGCAVVFFTSAGCPPCRIISPVFEELAAGSGSKAVFIKVDVGVARDIGSKYTISATPTFMSFSRGEKVGQ